MSKKKIFDFKLLFRVIKYGFAYKRVFIFSAILGILLTVLSPVRPVLLQRMIDDYIPKEKIDVGSFSYDIVTQGILFIFLVQIAVLIVETAVKFLFTFLTAFLGQSVIRDFRKRLFSKILSLNVRQFDKTPIGTLTTRNINDIESINQIFADGFIPIIIDLLTIVAILVVMFVYSWKLTLIALIPFPFLLLATYYFKESINKSFHKVRDAVASLNAFVQEHIGGMAIIKAFAAEEREADKFGKINEQHRTANVKAILAYSIFFPVVEIVSAISIALILSAALELPVGAGTVAFYFTSLGMIFRPLRFIADKFNTLQMGMISAERVFQFFDNPDVTKNDIPSDEHIFIKGKIEYENVFFQYIEGKTVLNDISFTQQAGEALAIVGHTGSGKSTIIHLLNRMYDISKGEILIDDKNIYSYPLASLRKNIGVISQDLFLFSDSIYNNIALYNPDITREEVYNFAKRVGIHRFIMSLPNQYDYQVHERGGTLSYGQRQLICFLRILAYNPKIFLFDEATSSIDTQSEKLIQKAIQEIIKDRTSIIIAHRLSTIKKAKHILVVDNGKIVEAGNHKSLYHKKGYYYELCNDKEEILV